MYSLFRYTRTSIILITLPLLLSGCETMNSLGSYLPVLGERCESSECFTESGRAESERIKREKAGREAARANGEADPAVQDPLPTPQPAPKSTGYSTAGTPWEQYNGQQ